MISLINKRNETPVMLQYLVDDYLGGYDLPRIRTRSNYYSLILIDGLQSIEFEAGIGMPAPDIVAITFDYKSWKPVVLYSDRTEAGISEMRSRSYVPADRFQLTSCDFSFLMKRSETPVMLQFLVNDYLPHYGLPKIRTNTVSYKLDRISGVVVRHVDNRKMIGFPSDIISIYFGSPYGLLGTYALLSDRREMFFENQRSFGLIPSEELYRYLRL